MSSGSLFFKKFEKKSSPPALSMAAEVRAASTATGSSHDKKAATASSVRDVQQSEAKDRQPVARGGQTPVRDRSTVIKSKVDNAGVKASAKCDEKEAKRRSSEVGVLRVCFIVSFESMQLASVIQSLDSVIGRINHYIYPSISSVLLKHIEFM